MAGELLLVEDLKEHADFWRERVMELQYKMLELRMEMDALDEELTALKREHADWDALRSQQGRTIYASLCWPCEWRVTDSNELCRFSRFWRSVYDAEVDQSGAISMRRYALVEQNTGSDWKGVPLTFLVGNPLESIAPPVPVQKRLTLVRSFEKDAYTWESSDEMDDFEGLKIPC